MRQHRPSTRLHRPGILSGVLSGVLPALLLILAFSATPAEASTSTAGSTPETSLTAPSSPSTDSTPTSTTSSTPTSTTDSTTSVNPAVASTPSVPLNPALSPSVSLNPALSPSVSLNPALSPSVSPALSPAVSAYWLVASDGGIFSFGGAPYHGSAGGIHLNKPVVGMSATSPTDSGGYWEVATDGGIFSYGDARFYGSTGGTHLNKPVVGMASTPSGHGYWLVASDGGIFTFGDAHFYGSTGNMHLNQPVVAMAPTPTGHGYWLVASDGGIFAFGDAHYYGSTGAIHLQQPIVAMAASHTGHGYWLVASDGGIFTFGDAPFSGSLGAVPQAHPIATMAANASGSGYWLTNSNGAVTAFGTATYWGSTPQVINKPIVGMAQATGNGAFTSGPYPSGSTGYDLSNYQCSQFPPAPHTVGIIEVVGQSFGSVNQCLAREAAWAGAGLNLYLYLTAGTQPTSGDPACAATYAPTACNYGFSAAQDAYQKAVATHINTAVAWWIDVEPDPSWSKDTQSNATLVQGAIEGLRAEGLNSVGIYASPYVWPELVGNNYQPAVPYWAAHWNIAPSTTCRNVHTDFPYLPTGPVELVQYQVGPVTTPSGPVTYDQDYAC